MHKGGTLAQDEKSNATGYSNMHITDIRGIFDE